MRFEELQHLLDPNEVHPTPFAKWTDADIETLSQARRKALEANLAEAKGRFDRINCKQALREFLGFGDLITFHRHRLRALRCHGEGEKALEAGNKAIARRYVAQALESVRRCRELAESAEDIRPLDAATEDAFLRLEALGDQLGQKSVAPRSAPPPKPTDNKKEKDSAPSKSSAGATQGAPAASASVPVPPDAIGGLLHAFALSSGSRLTLVGREHTTLGRGRGADVFVDVDKAEHLDEDQSLRRISRVHLTVFLKDEEIIIADGHRPHDGKDGAKPSGNGTYLGANRIREEALLHHPQRELRLIDFRSAPGIPSWKLQCWRARDFAPPDSAVPVLPKWRPEQPAALFMQRRDRKDDILFVWAGFPLTVLWPGAPGWIVRHNEGFLYLGKDLAWYPLTELPAQAGLDWKAHT